MNTAVRGDARDVSTAAVLRWGESRLRSSPSARLDAEVLLAHALGRDRAALYRERDAVVDDPVRASFAALVRARAAGRPVAQLVGEAEFYSLGFHVDADVLVPRAETEGLVDVTLELLAHTRGAVVADLGTGSGAVAVALATERPDARILATDRCARALAVARRNCARHAVGNVGLARGHWLAALAPGRFDAVVSNPPYIADADPHLRHGDIRHEPRGALVAGNDGLHALRELARDAPAKLRPGGWLVVEHGYNQGAAVRHAFAQAGLQDVSTRRDLAGHERITLGHR